MQHFLRFAIPVSPLTRRNMALGFRRFGLGLLMVILGVYEPLLSQTISLGPADLYSISAFNPKTKSIYRIWPDSVRAYLAPDFTKTIKTEIKNQVDDFPKAYKSLFIRDSLYFVNRSGGLIYRMKGDSLVREDRSFMHQMQINSAIFVRNDTILKYGGYGFWSARNFFTYFSTDSHEWEILAPYGSTEVPPGSHTGEVALKDSLLYVFSGYTVDKSNPLKTDSPLKEVWSFNVNLHKWTLLGSDNEHPNTSYNGIHMGDRILKLTDRKFMLFDPAKNNITYFKIAQKHFMIPMFSDPAFTSYYAAGSFYLLTYQSNHGQGETELILEVVPENELLKIKLDETPLYEENSFPWKPVLVVLLSFATLSFIWIGRVKSKRNQLITVFNNSVSFKQKSIDLEPNAIKVLKAIVQSGGELSSQEVLLLSENRSLSEAHNLKIKNQIIDSINLRLKTLVGEPEDLIVTSKSSEDRRMKTYKIDYKRFMVKV